MRWDSVHLAGLGTWLPEPTPIEKAIEAGECGREWTDSFGYLSVLIADETAPPDMAVHAAASALKRSGVAPEDFSLLLHGSIWFQGLDIWPAASYIAQRTVGGSVPAIDVQQRCNVGVSALELAAAHITAGRTDDAVMITTADRFAAPAADRWRLRHGNAYADGGTAMVLSGRGGFARLLATATAADNTLEGRARGKEPFTTVSRALTEPIDLKARAEQDDMDDLEVSGRIARMMLTVRNRLLADAGIDQSQIAYAVFPSVGKSDGEMQLHDLFCLTEEQTTWEFARRVGHIGPGDQCAGLAHLLTGGMLSPGDKVVLWGGGAGYTLSAAVVEIDELPDWAA
ncbi:ketoacyl-ACP synthase III family protein [Actinoallomurus sp. CA-150999]|uniref:ketoacyl-ACP synthase III family protein n=1 Tax=Actinoallomurus sp. CA-150999 TaxID=3239887 RepID=UPI003D8A91B4